VTGRNGLVRSGSRDADAQSESDRERAQAPRRHGPVAIEDSWDSFGTSRRQLLFSEEELWRYLKLQGTVLLALRRAELCP
jgi:hypothetical protein